MMIASLIVLSGMVREQSLKWCLFYVCGWILYSQIQYLYLGHDVLKMARSSGMCVHLIMALGIYHAVVRSKLSNTYWYNIICIGAIGQATIAFLQPFGIDPFVMATDGFIPFKDLATSPVGTFGNQNFLTAFLVVSTPFFFRKYWCLFLPVIAWVVGSSGVSGSILALLLVFMIVLKRWKYVAVAIAVGLAALLFDSGTTITDIRWEWWNAIYERVVDEPLRMVFGYGPGVEVLLGTVNNNIHNDWFSLIIKFGLVFYIPIAVYVFKIKKDILFLALLGAWACAFTTQVMSIPVTACLIVIIMALMERDKWRSFPA
jgi:hypothetical protein